MLLRHERRMILETASEYVLAFDEAVYDLRRERMFTAAHLKAADLKLLVLRQARKESPHGNIASIDAVRVYMFRDDPPSSRERVFDAVIISSLKYNKCFFRAKRGP